MLDNLQMMAEQTAMLQRVFNNLQADLIQHLPQVKARNTSVEELGRFVGAFLTMRVRQHFITEERANMGMNLIVRVDMLKTPLTIEFKAVDGSLLQKNLLLNDSLVQQIKQQLVVQLLPVQRGAI